MTDVGVRVLIVDDEPEIVELLAYNLREHRYRVAAVRDGRSALAEVRRCTPDLVLLDLNLPDIPGTEICRRLRRDPATAEIPIIVISARTDEIDRVVGLELGADDYVTKPFSLREVVLRVAAVLRRTSMRNETPVLPERIEIGPLVIDTGRHEVQVHGQAIALTAIEFRLLHDLASHIGRVQTREALLERVWGYGPGVQTRTVDTHVRRLREKLGPARDLIETMRGAGYRMRSA